MNYITPDFITKLAGSRPPCLSLYQPTHRHYPENQQDPILFRNLVKELEQSLKEKYSAPEIATLLEPYRALIGDTEFWNHTFDGLAVFLAPGIFQVFKTKRPLAKLAVVADSFHTKPLKRLLQSAGRYQVLGVSRHSIRLFEGNRDGLAEIDIIPEIPHTIAEALGKELPEPHLTVSSYGGIGSSSSPMHHGQGGKSDVIDTYTERFFRVIDRGVLEHYSQKSGLPLILAALGEHQAMFHRISQNPYLVAEGIPLNPESVSLEELSDRAWEHFKPRYTARLKAAGDEYRQACSKGFGSDDLAEVAKAALAGRIATLLIESEKQIPGRLDAVTGQVQPGNLADPQVDDMLDDLSDLVEGKGGEVLVVDSADLPSKTGLAATYRF
jgi:hypothetical protein